MVEQKPDMISTCFNPHDECFHYEPGREPVELYGLHNRPELEEYCRATAELGVKIEAERFHYGGVWNAQRRVQKGLMKPPVWIDFLLGWRGGSDTPPPSRRRGRGRRGWVPASRPRGRAGPPGCGGRCRGGSRSAPRPRRPSTPPASVAPPPGAPAGTGPASPPTARGPAPPRWGSA